MVPLTKNSIKVIWIACVISFSFLLCGASRIFTAYLVSQLSKDGSTMKINSNEASWLGSIGSLSNPIGFLFGGFSMDVLGRKWSTKFLFLPFIIGWALITCSTNLLVIYTGIGLHGIAAGMTMVSSVYVSEIASYEYRGFSLSLLNLSYMLGIMICSVLQCISSWRCTACFFLISSILMLIASHLIPESPYWLVMKGRVADAVSVLKTVRNPIFTDNYLKEIQNIQREIDDIQECVISKNSDIKPLSKLGKVYDQICSLLFIWKQMSVLLVLALLHRISGFLPLGHYTVTFFCDLHTPVNSDYASLVYSVVCFFSTLLVPYFIHFYNRRKLLFISSVLAGLGMSTTLGYECLFYTNLTKPYFWIALLGIYTYAAASSIGITSILVMLPAEILPRNISGLSIAVYSILCSLMSITIAKTYFSVVQTIQIYGLLGTCVTSCFILALLALLLLPETRGKSLLDIQKSYMKDEVQNEERVRQKSITLC